MPEYYDPSYQNTPDSKILYNSDGTVREDKRPEWEKNPLTQDEYTAQSSGNYIDEFTSRAFTNYIAKRDAWRKENMQKYPIGGGPPDPYGRGGNGVFNDFAKSAVTDKAYREQFKKRPEESLDQWKARVSMEFQGFDVAFDSSDLATDPEAMKFFGYTTKGPEGKSPAQIEAEKIAEEERKTREEIRAFSDSLKIPLSADDPQVKHILGITQQSVSNQARLRGIEGPMAIGAMTQSTNNQLLDYNKDRESRYFSALQYKDASQLRDGQARDAARYGEWQAEAGAAQQRAANSPLPMILGGAGAAVGGVAGFFGGGFNPATAAMGASAGWGLGRGAGTALSQPNIPPPPASRYGYGGGR